MNPGAFVKYCALLIVVPAFSVLCACGVFDEDHKAPPLLYSFTIGPGSTCGPELIVRTEDRYPCPFELRAGASWTNTTFAVGIQGVRERADRECPAFDIPQRLTWSTCFTPPGEAFRSSSPYGKQTSLFDVTGVEGAFTAEPVVPGPSFIRYVPPDSLVMW